ncbi:hypothetical protein ABT56_11555 [Photobacterium aquae]|uniref:Uncharacterized protein n=1 Tax=Photobacterium aquae TaxID=1195763 RepID=A0A0J1H0J0_9GAMM|nr:hypothetical protein [Photobacterium aquae]KLV05353.1 hypothetical protein ABT56_11555 [Photobacterium aquae]
MKVYFSDFFDVDEALIDAYGAFNPSLLNDLPLFIDPFLLYINDDDELRNLHNEVINYVAFLKEQANEKDINSAELQAWFMFPEVRQNWFGYSEVGCGGHGLGKDFADSLNNNLNTIFMDFGDETVTKESHLEKLCLIKDGVGKDTISDFTTNLIKQFLLEYTQKFSAENIDKKYLSAHMVKKVYFDYDKKKWMPKEYILPTYNDDFVLLTPKSILTKDKTWINKADLLSRFDGIVDAMPNHELREKINDYLSKCLPEDYKNSDYKEAIKSTISKYPEYIDYFIKSKEDGYKEARLTSDVKVADIEKLYIENLREIYSQLSKTEFYDMSNETFDELYMKAQLFKDVIESRGGYKLVFTNQSKITKEAELRLLIKLVFLAQVKHKYQLNLSDRLSFKLASNPVLKQSIGKKLKEEEGLDDNDKSIFAIVFYSDKEFNRVTNILKDLRASLSKTLFMIDARPSE